MLQQFLFGVVVVSCCCALTDGFLWDETTISRLFGTRQEVYDKLLREATTQEEVNCLRDFDGFVQDLFRGGYHAERGKISLLTCC